MQVSLVSQSSLRSAKAFKISLYWSVCIRRLVWQQWSIHLIQSWVLRPPRYIQWYYLVSVRPQSYDQVHHFNAASRSLCHWLLWLYVPLWRSGHVGAFLEVRDVAGISRDLRVAVFWRKGVCGGFSMRLRSLKNSNRISVHRLDSVRFEVLCWSEHLNCIDSLSQRSFQDSLQLTI